MQKKHKMYKMYKSVSEQYKSSHRGWMLMHRKDYDRAQET